MTRLSIFDVPCLCFGQVQQLRKLHPVSRRLIEQQQKFRVCEHQPRRFAFQAFLHILRSCGQRCAILSPALPRTIEDVAGILEAEEQVG